MRPKWPHLAKTRRIGSCVYLNFRTGALTHGHAVHSPLSFLLVPFSYQLLANLYPYIQRCDGHFATGEENHTENN